MPEIKETNLIDKAEPKAKDSRPRRTKKVDPSYEYKRALTVLCRELGKLMDLSHKPEIMDPTKQTMLISYIKILNDLNELSKLEESIKGESSVQKV